MDDWIEELWVEQRPAAAAKVARVAAAAAAATAGTLDEAMREDASGVAHQLAGSLGTYGRADAAEAAAVAEAVLAEEVVDAVALADAVRRMEAAVADG